MMENDYERRPGMGLSGCRRIVFNILTVIVVLTTVVVGIALIAVFINPYLSINPYPPPTLPPTLGSPTPTQTPARTLPPAWTATPTEDGTIELETTPSPTEAPETATATITETPEEEAEYPFVLQVGSPAPIENFINGMGCDFLGVFGQVFNEDNQPVLELTVHLGGELEGVGEIDLYALTGSEPDAGPGGYLFNVATEPIASSGTLWIQLEDGDGNPISEQVYFDTSDACSENLILVNWRQVR
ncbi:MAG: hypothetical protein P8Z34_07610 [Anaerolineales bacterium]|jgi:hypothetical protein